MQKKDRRQLRKVNPALRNAIAIKVITHYFVFVLFGSVAGIAIQYCMNPQESWSSRMSSLMSGGGSFLIAFVLLAPSFILDMVKMSSRIAGPIFKMTRTLNAIADWATPEKLLFRKNDFFGELAAAFNRGITRAISSVDKNKASQSS